VCRAQAFVVIQGIVGFAAEALRPIVDVEQDRVVGLLAGADQLADIGFANRDARVVEGAGENLRHRPARPFDDGRYQFSNGDLSLRPQYLERRPQGEAHPQAADQDTRLLGGANPVVARNRRQRLFGRTETSAHQLLVAQHDDEFGAALFQAQHLGAAGHFRRVEYFPGNHRARLSAWRAHKK